MIFERCFESTRTTETDGDQEKCASGTNSGHCIQPRGRRCEDRTAQRRLQRPVSDGMGWDRGQYRGDKKYSMEGVKGKRGTRGPP